MLTQDHITVVEDHQPGTPAVANMSITGNILLQSLIDAVIACCSWGRAS